MSLRGMVLVVLVVVCGVGLMAGPADAGTGIGYSFSFNAPEGFSNALAAGVDQSDGDVYVSDFGTGLLWKFKVNLAGDSAEPEEAFGVKGHVEMPGLAFQPTVDNYPGGAEDVFVPELNSGMVSKLSPSGVMLALATPIDGVAQPTGVGVDANGSIYVAELGGAVVKFNAAGKPVNAAGEESSENTLASAPSRVRAMAVDSTGEHIYLASESGVIQYVLSGDKYVQGVTLAEGSFTTGVAIVPAVAPSAGDVFVESNGEILEYEPSGQLLTRFGAGLLSGGAARLAVYGTASGTTVYAPNEGAGVAVFVEGDTPEAPVTEPASEVTSGSALLHGELNPGAAEGKVGYYFAYNLGASCTGGATSASGEAEGNRAKVSTEVAGLQPSAHYTFCVFATNGFGPTEGSAQTLLTAGVKPSVDGESVSGVRSSGATLEAQVNPNNQETKYFFEYAVNKELTGATIVPVPSASLSAGFGDQLASADIEGALKSGMTYYYRVITENETGIMDGTVQSFATPGQPVVGPVQAQGPTSTSVLLSGTVNPMGADTTYHFAWIDQAGYQAALAESAANPYALGARTNSVAVGSSFEAQSIGPVIVSELLPSTTYHYALIASNEVGITIGPDATFTTGPPTPPVATTGGVSNISQNEAMLSATIDTEGLQTTYGFEIATSTNYGPPTGLGSVGAGANEAPVALSLTGLLPGTTYYYRIEATSLDGTSYGTDQTFTTPLFANAFATPPAPLPFVAVPAIVFPVETKGNSTTTPKALTNAQKLAKALKACKRKPKKQRAGCEKQARRRYAPAKKKRR